MRPMIIGNWKMNGGAASIAEAFAVCAALRRSPVEAEIALCPPATLIAPLAAALAAGPVSVGCQDCHWDTEGAYTGDMSAAQLAEAGATLAIVGHSERRTFHGETDRDIAGKAAAAFAAGLTPIICVGETLEQRRAGRALEIVAAQLRAALPDPLPAGAFAVAYEPVWAIGSGRTPNDEEIVGVHLALREVLTDRLGLDGGAAPILYGGSVNPGNAASILRLPEVGGALVGGASLRAADFLAVVVAGAGAAPSSRFF